jgi:hypothetical protein
MAGKVKRRRIWINPYHDVKPLGVSGIDDTVEVLTVEEH